MTAADLPAVAATLELARRVRFCVDLAGDAAGYEAAGRHNTFAAWPSTAGLGAFYELEVACRGQADAVTGYMVNITAIDEAVREHVIPLIQSAIARRERGLPGELLPRLLAALAEALPGLWSIRWHLTPYHAIAMTADQPQRVMLTQQFEFAAAHRLHCPTLSDDENRRVFGKCNNPSGHGHNYRLEPAVAVPVADASRLTLPELERIVDEVVIRRFDHTNLNTDTTEFASMNPSVENIAKVCHDLLAGPIAEAGGELRHVTVWETEKTRCTYPAR